MTNKELNQYIPDYLVKPGEILEEYLDNLCMSQLELATRTGLSKKTINEIIQGKSPITPETALKLERVLERPAHFWNNLERQYQEDRTRLMDRDRLQNDINWLKRIPVNAMIKLGWIKKADNKVSQLEEALRFFGVASPKQWETLWNEYDVTYRQTRKSQPQIESISAWLRKGELDAQRISCAPFNRVKFQEALDKIRNLTREAPDLFQPRLKELCAAAGVAVVFVPELPKTGVYGATRWMGDKAVIQLSLRYRSNDHLWFTFFHEAGHILKHGRKEVFIEDGKLTTDKEREADIFAMDKLIPPERLKDLIRQLNGYKLEPIIHFANEINIAPGIVVGRLQHDGALPKSHGNKLKVFYSWGND
ncbi:MAG: HigA family addiction module antidote protein [Deltaproteobacteria bacterium]|uniref:HigA family addiction module antidote protein n=1 Tax=Candidatus Zymogenus saltonus TaxID=2844893 RepID=A0A9D8PPF6_9DELT|nr:HigA family addiction module antidote protein [Candidatus Zymogenus saltonus]